MAKFDQYSAKDSDTTGKHNELVNQLNRIYAGVPSGCGMEWYSSTPPEGWLLQDGSAISRTTYAELFAKIGIAFGAGDGTTTFNLPNRSGKVAIGVDSSDSNFNAIGKTYGEKTHALSQAELPNINLSSVEKRVGGTGTVSGLQYADNKSDFGTWNIPLGGSGTAHNNIQPSIAIYYIIKY